MKEWGRKEWGSPVKNCRPENILHKVNMSCNLSQYCKMGEIMGLRFLSKQEKVWNSCTFMYVLIDRLEGFVSNWNMSSSPDGCEKWKEGMRGSGRRRFKDKCRKRCGKLLLYLSGTYYVCGATSREGEKKLILRGMILVSTSLIEDLP